MRPIPISVHAYTKDMEQWLGDGGDQNNANGTNDCDDEAGDGAIEGAVANFMNFLGLKPEGR